ncbi:hypothetical protein FB451DRAFT_1276560 [Mycena latifolia]|nr:hypothetical protein FB451DRAFT_1276560 [Mycena latifolia]
MSFGRPPSINVGFKPTPPDRGSFPLDHYGPQYAPNSDLGLPLTCVTPIGECKEQMKLYMTCLRDNSSTSSPCRLLSKDYLDCRMTKFEPVHRSLIRPANGFL